MTLIEPEPSRRVGEDGGQQLTWAATLDSAIALAADMGLNPDEFFTEIDVTPGRAGRAPPRVAIDLLARFLTWAAETSGDFSFGLKLGARVHPRDLGAYGYLLLNSPTLGDAMALGRRFVDFQQQGDALVWKFSRDGHFEVRYDAQGLKERFRRQDAECTLAIVHAVIQSLGGRHVHPVEARVQHDPREGGPKLEDHFSCPVIYGDRGNALRYKKSLLDLPIRGADPQLLSILVQHVEHELEGLPPRGDELGRVRWVIRRSLGTGLTNVESVARQCGLGVRTLQRRLAAHGVTFSDLVDLVRQEVSAELEMSGPRSRHEMAEILGFGDASAFAKARRRWSRGKAGPGG
ncbi:MAG: AraC family transcriptional regulator ligand-binding domain-containing protein [Parvibaculum sp.]|nr:AraC family transcriptional regulator ligand-binding domain-containing protein [Parvibaculum sp.]